MSILKTIFCFKTDVMHRTVKQQQSHKTHRFSTVKTQVEPRMVGSSIQNNEFLGVLLRLQPTLQTAIQPLGLGSHNVPMRSRQRVQSTHMFRSILRS